MSKFGNILKNHNFFFLWLGQIISQVGDRLGQMALIAFVYLRAPGSTVEIAKILSFTIIPVFLIGPIAGVYVDRWDRRRTMYICDFLRAVLVLIIPLFLFYAERMALLYFLIFIIFAIGRFFVPAKLAIIPDLVQEKDLLMANSLVHITGMIAAVLGFGISGVLVEWLGAKGGFYLDAGSFLISGLLIFLIAKKTIPRVNLKKVGHEIVEVIDKIKKSVFQEVKEGILYFVRNKDIRFTAGVMFILSSALGAASVVLIAFVQNTLHSATLDLGLVMMFFGLGLFFGSLSYGRFGSKISHYKMIFSSLILSGIMLIIFVFVLSGYPYFINAAALSFLLGFVVSPTIIASITIIHNVSDNAMMGKIFSSIEIIIHLGFLIFMYISGLLAEKYSHVLILFVVGCIFTLLGLVNFIYYSKTTWLK
ncbi:MAG: hypothetical protein DRP74_00275 [Candidatus Omnitrophota bacterium]|nr:MAG: hypothetical protein DRP74_00275 [Candidatus Omnitrophota bacterium]